jgi:hypothetical protein
MLIFTTRFSKKKAIFSVLLMGVVMVALILLAGRSSQKEAATPLPQLTDNDQRVAYLQSLGWEVAEEPVETLQFLLPETLEEPYLTYNELQLPQGFDLTAFCGKQVSRYTYTVTNYPGRSEGVQANLYVCDAQPVAGDILCAGANGFQEPLVQTQA